MTTRPVVVLGAVVAALVIVLGVADATAGRPRSPQPPVTAGSEATVRQATVVCPDVGGGPGDAATWVRAAGTSTIGTPSITSTAITSKPSGFAPADKALGLAPYGAAFGGQVTAGSQALALTATASSAVGLGAVQVTRDPGGPTRGLSATGCVAPGTEFAFVGGSTTVGNELELVLTNIDTTAASVDVALLGSSGAVSTPGSNGLMVAGHSRLTVDLQAIGPNQPALTTIVTAVTGRVAAAERATSINGSIPLGVDWIPNAGLTTREAIIPGMTKDTGRRTLVIADPGPNAATVTVQVLSDTGPFTPTDFDALAVPSGSVASFDVTRALAGHPGALLVTSDQPIYAGASQLLGSKPASTADFSWSAQTAALTGPAVLPVAPIDGPAKRSTAILLSAAPLLASSVLSDKQPATLVTITANGANAGPPVHVWVSAGTTVAADLGALLKPASGDLSVVVSVAPGPIAVAASAVFREATGQGPMIAQVGLVSVPGVIELPAVEEDPTVIGVRPGELAPSTGP